MDDPLQPACWSWASLLGQDEYLAELRSRHTLSESTIRRITAAWVETQFDAFHDGRCAICGITGVHHVQDHDHETGLVRGWLCRSCNTTEGKDRGGVFGLYRQRNPATILGARIVYAGWGWEAGAPIGGRQNPGDPVKDNPLRGIGL